MGATSAPVGDSASTGDVVASTELSRFVPEVEAVEAAEANPTSLRWWLGKARSGRFQHRLDREYPANDLDALIFPSLKQP